MEIKLKSNPKNENQNKIKFKCPKKVYEIQHKNLTIYDKWYTLINSYMSSVKRRNIDHGR